MSVRSASHEHRSLIGCTAPVDVHLYDETHMMRTKNSSIG